MSATHQASTDGNMPLPAQTSSVILGRQDYVSVLLRLIGMELYKIRRRVMSKVLGTIAIAIAILIFVVISLGTIYVLNAPPESFAPPCQGSSIQGSQPPGSPPQESPSTNCPQPSAAQLTQFRQDALRSVSEPLRLPSSLNVVVQFALSAGTILIIILIGATAGGEFSIGTVRLLFTRGPTRTQFLLSKLGATIICIAVGILTMSIVGILTGQVLNLLSGIAQSFDFLSATWVAHTMLYLLIAMLDWFMYAAIAIFFGILGRSTVAGIVGAMTWLFVEPILAGVLRLAGSFSHGPFVDFLKSIPDYFIGNNIGALLQNQGQYIFGGSASSLSNLHALIVLAVYLTAFIGLAWRLNEWRDVTN
jgi:ABC-type transport system involved in multi-copper enzyme maturation permease subunit